MSSKNTKDTKICKYCREEIDANAKVCPKCHKTQKIPVIIIILICFFGLGLIGAVFGGGSEETTDNSAKTEENVAAPDKSSNNSSQPTIEYIKVSKDELDDALEGNAAAAKDKYATKYLEINGKLGTIDSDLSYFYLMSDTEEYDFNGVYCKLKNSQQKDQIKTLQKDQLITVKGQVTGVGEYMGYHINVTEIIAR